MKDKDVLTGEDLTRIGNCVWETAEDQDDERLRKYARTLWRMADSMLSDDGIVVTDEYFDRQHGV